MLPANVSGEPLALEQSLPSNVCSVTILFPPPTCQPRNYTPFSDRTGYCFGALVVSKLVDTLELPISPGVGVCNAYPACILAVLGTEHRDFILLYHQLRVIKFWNVVSIISGELHTLSSK